MTDQTPPPTLAERALQRLRKIASGNGLEPAAITLIEAQEQIFALGGKMEVSPLCETESVSYPGGARGKDRKVVDTVPALQEAVALHKREFQENMDWVAAVTAELLAHENKGWGLENAKVTLTQKSATYAVTGACPSCDGRQLLTCAQCQGRGTVICTQCQGQGRELCYYCGGRGENPQQPGQRCATCNGTRYAPCRFCQTHGHLPCPTCNGRRGTSCPMCQGNGKLTQEIAVTCGAETHFKIQAEGLPSGLRRGLERIGIATIGKGHADITAEPAPEDKDERGAPTARGPQNGGPIPVLIYKAALPYAELRMGFGGKKAIVSVFGKRCAIMGAPNFLDDTLKPWREKLRQAALGKGPLEQALEARAIKEILALTVSGKGRESEIRKLYPFGLSAPAIASMLADIRLTLNRATLKTRAVIAALCVGLCAALFYSLFLTGWHAAVTRGWGIAASLAADSGILGATLIASWAILNFSARFVLQKRFPQMQVALQQKIGKTGYSMLAGIVAAFGICVFLSPLRPLWLAMLLR